METPLFEAADNEAAAAGGVVGYAQVS